MDNMNYGPLPGAEQSPCKPISDIALNGLVAELEANKSAYPLNEFSHGFNDGISFALSLILKYRNGKGLFQVDTPERAK